ncbi:MAG: geranyl transferase [Sulfurimonas sp. RIFCSPHIGHO2_12_FULL_36_9]|uniref:polyprenyl synthetase family protein n=1 Tax=Sulfurimonas sp. RIFCSPLOWO2_12_36_12 TaxID=1802253 RepID=UPI0008AF1A78|nr:polyprenyl synthetase family protein [Sulfurimonas sp. RIFCSPLOWO2_12_36_12]OHD97119.1 MAG: geranyl transferase [Sulfurimonas sp. RIFCSPLOWO2_02_FULL_36_28]OHD99445.1 MAG: geranyl transferase [Sulfurimonas sp. RIFCSPHIGHO2_12_FULL_36_9]OHE01690.1 MAG: geranyl transferase [Sulfurimonas sp. RIFCSPLOWO2_12_36_12]OHE07990.1 MAG: geranyl transferase [Sulfurimonas sp. RIFCSPLOWO2_12_FULL_36_74]
MQNFENFLLNNLPTSKSIHPTYEEALRKMLIAGGKRFRPALLLGVVNAYNPLLIGGAHHAAYAIELLHTYSLIHDDLPAMDNSPLRRGEPTLHVIFDEVTAILAGDALNTYSFEVLSNAPFSDYTRVELIRELATNGGLNGMVLGQAIDCYFENKPLSIEDVKILHTNKTAKLIAASLKMGAIIVGREKLGEKLYDFGIKLGLLFQIQDDILDVTLSSQEAGKLTNNDEAKNSFVTLLGLDSALKEANGLADELIVELNGFDEKLKNELSPLLTQYINRHK